MPRRITRDAGVGFPPSLSSSEYLALMGAPRSETDLQQAVLRLLGEEYPALLVRSGLEGARRTPGAARTAKRLGMARGWPDLMVLGPGRFLGFIELKFGKNKEQADQVSMRLHLESLGFPCAVCWDIPGVRAVLKEWVMNAGI